MKPVLEPVKLPRAEHFIAEYGVRRNAALVPIQWCIPLMSGAGFSPCLSQRRMSLSYAKFQYTYTRIPRRSQAHLYIGVAVRARLRRGKTKSYDARTECRRG